MKWGSQLKVPFEPGELVQTRFGGEPVFGEVQRAGEGSVLIRWGSGDAVRHLFVPWWSGPTLVRPAIRGYPYERKVPGAAWVLFWIRYLPYRLWRGLRFRR